MYVNDLVLLDYSVKPDYALLTVAAASIEDAASIAAPQIMLLDGTKGDMFLLEGYSEVRSVKYILDSKAYTVELVHVAQPGSSETDIAVRSASALMFVTMAESDSFDATTLAEHSVLFDRWVQGIAYKLGQIRIDETNGILYRCITAHGAEHATKPPSQSPTLWGRIADPADEWPEWFPYSGVNDAWMKGSKCTHKGKRWTSNVDYNVWEPGVSQWTEVI